MIQQTLSTFYINLSTRQDRRDFMEEQFARLGVLAERVEAATVADLGEEDLGPHKSQDNPWLMAPVEIACALSHRRIWQMVVDRDLPAALILEDDVILGDAVPALLADFPRFADLGAGILRLETSLRGVRLGPTITTMAGRFEVKRLVSHDYGAGAYIITADMARRCLADPRRFATSVDGYLFMRRGRFSATADILQLDPSPCVQLSVLGSDSTQGVGASDLAPSRATVSGVFTSISRRIRRRDNLAYDLRATWAMLATPSAIFAGKRRIPHDRAP